MTDRSQPDLAAGSPPSTPAGVPAGSVTADLEDHAAEIIFDPYLSYEPGCVRRRRAAAGAMFDVFDDAVSPAGIR